MIVFFQSSIDKVIDRNGNLDFLKVHFKNTIFQNHSAFSLTLLTLFEFMAALLCFFGIIYRVFYLESIYIFYGLLLCAIVLLMLLLGQRLAKDYVGAVDITVYFILCIITIMSF
tara:strand:+ start:104 stop:445 length:342 start_codon:yes stop_codon:yes gene_type:complete